MVAAMAVEVFVYLYAFSFALATLISVILLVAAARKIGRTDKKDVDKMNDSFE